jgi:hypothetical protein
MAAQYIQRNDQLFTGLCVAFEGLKAWLDPGDRAGLEVGVRGPHHPPGGHPLAEEIALADANPDDAVDPGEDAGELEGLDRLADGRHSAARLIGDRLIAGGALAAATVVDEPQHRVEHVDELAGQHAVMFAPLGLVLQRPGEVHDPDLGLALERDARTVTEDLLTARAKVIR